MFRLPWCGELMASKFTDKIALDKFRQTSMADIPVFNQLKRKREDSIEVYAPHLAPEKKLRTESIATQPPAVNAPASDALPAQPSQPASENAPASSTPRTSILSGQLSTFSVAPNLASIRSRPDMKIKPGLRPLSTSARPVEMDPAFANPLTPLQQTIENEFNMQILMKHNELRLIEQELAKCQIALEQLRRCEVRPYPGSNGISASVSEGTGPSIAPPAGFSRPTHPAPHGVTDGPYSSHYRQWLLHDPAFESAQLQIPAPADVQSDTRTTRYNGVPKKSFASKPTPPANRRAESLHSIPNYPSLGVKDKSQPLVLRRSTDGKLVKLICNNCHRGDFSSIQGFLNHCRIAHKVDYKSHDLAAIDCGHPLDDAELAKLPTETQTMPAPKPIASRAASLSSTPVRSNFVHPLNTTTSGLPAMAPRAKPQSAMTPVRSLATTAAPNQPQASFTASSQVPRLSQLFAKHNYGGNLEQAVAAARQKIDIGREEALSPDASQFSSPVAPSPDAQRSGPDAIHRPVSRKGYRQPAQRHRPTPLVSSSSSHVEELTQSPMDTSSTTFSPHAVDSNPGLVSDHEDDHDGSASEEEAPHGDLAHPLPATRHCTDNMEIDIDDHDGIDEHGVIIRRNSITAAEARSMRSGVGKTGKKMGGGK